VCVTIQPRLLNEGSPPTLWSYRAGDTDVALEAEREAAQDQLENGEDHLYDTGFGDRGQITHDGMLAGSHEES
jgi:hypothetical protein